MADSTQIDDPEVLRVQMEESREALSQKIEMLEEKVTDTVQNATASVAEATANVLETVQTATASVSETVDSVTNAVQGTVDNVRHSMEDTVDSVKDAFDLSHQVEQHPWLMMGGAVAIGFLGASFVGSCGTGASTRQRSGMSEKDHASNGQAEPSRDVPFRPSYTSSLPIAPSAPVDSTDGIKKETAGPSWLQRLGESFAPEINKLEGLAIGAVVGALRDVVIEAAPSGIRKELQAVIDDFTDKLGGHRLPSHALDSEASA